MPSATASDQSSRSPHALVSLPSHFRCTHCQQRGGPCPRGCTQSDSRPSDEALLHAAVANTSEPSRSALGHVSNYASLHLVQPPGDNSIIRVQYGNLFWRGRVPYGMMLLSGTVKGTVVDIGANIGAVAIAIAKRHPTLRVIACEPAPVTFFYLLWK